VATPVIAPPDGTTFSISLDFTITCDTFGATIVYTTDGSDPNRDVGMVYDPLYHYDAYVLDTATVKAMAYLDEYRDSEVAAVSYTLTGAVADPFFSPKADTYSNLVTVTIVSGTPKDEVHYTLDGTDPTDDSDLYTGPIKITQMTTIKAQAFRSDLAPSNIVEATYIIFD